MHFCQRFHGFMWKKKIVMIASTCDTCARYRTEHWRNVAMNHDCLHRDVDHSRSELKDLPFIRKYWRKKFIVLTTNMAVLSRGWKPRMLCDFSANQRLTMPDVKNVYFGILLVYSTACDCCDERWYSIPQLLQHVCCTKFDWLIDWLRRPASGPLIHDNLKWQSLQSIIEDHKIWLTGASSQLYDAAFRYIFCYRYHVVVWVVLGEYVPLMLPDVT